MGRKREYEWKADANTVIKLNDPHAVLLKAVYVPYHPNEYCYLLDGHNQRYHAKVIDDHHIGIHFDYKLAGRHVAIKVPQEEIIRLKNIDSQLCQKKSNQDHDQ